MNEDDRLIVQAMEVHGGGFVQALARTCLRADLPNFLRIKAAFPELWEEYGKIVKQLKDDVRRSHEKFIMTGKR